jgi:hypothetical protein
MQITLGANAFIAIENRGTPDEPDMQLYLHTDTEDNKSIEDGEKYARAFMAVLDQLVGNLHRQLDEPEVDSAEPEPVETYCTFTWQVGNEGTHGCTKAEGHEGSAHTCLCGASTMRDA